jgi:hypothetical protein
MMKRIVQLTLMIGFVLAALGGSVHADHHEKIKVLYMGGRGHDSDGYYKSISGQLAKQGDFELVLSNNLDDLKAETINYLSGKIRPLEKRIHGAPSGREWRRGSRRRY